MFSNFLCITTLRRKKTLQKNLWTTVATDRRAYCLDHGSDSCTFLQTTAAQMLSWMKHANMQMSKYLPFINAVPSCDTEIDQADRQTAKHRERKNDCSRSRCSIYWRRVMTESRAEIADVADRSVRSSHGTVSWNFVLPAGT